MKTFNECIANNILSKEELYQYYITENHSQTECKAYFYEKYGITPTIFMHLLHYYKIYKPKELHMDQINKTKLEKYGSTNYNGHDSFKFIYTEEEELAICNRYLAGENIWSINRDLHTHMVETILKKHNMPLRSAKENKKITAIKRAATNLSRYGTTNAACAHDTIVKIKSTWQNKDSKTKLIIKEKSWKKYKYNDIFFDSSWELYYYIWCIDHNKKIIRNPEPISYIFNNYTHKYHPDFMVDGQLVEIKSDYLYTEMQKPGTQDFAKLQCMLANNVKILLLENMNDIFLEIDTRYGQDFIDKFKIK